MRLLSKFFTLFILCLAISAQFSLVSAATESKQIDIECQQDVDNNSRYSCYGSGDEAFEFPRPQINVSFPDSQNASFFNRNDFRWVSDSADIDFSTVMDDHTAIFLSDYFLGDGDYKLEFEAKYDAKKLFLEVEIDFSIDANQSPIWVETPGSPFVELPRFAMGNTNIYDLGLFLGYPEGHDDYDPVDAAGLKVDVCRYGAGTIADDITSLEDLFDVLPRTFTNNETDDNRFFEKPFDVRSVVGQGYVEETLRPMQVVCRDEGGRFSAEQLQVGVFSEGPQILGGFDPEIIRDGFNRKTTIELDLDQPSICHVSGRPSQGSYGSGIEFESLELPISVFGYSDFYLDTSQISNSLPISSESRSVDVEFTCTGLSNLNSSRTFSFSTDFQEIQSLEIVEPGDFVNSNSANVTVEVPIEDSCYVSVNDDTQESFEQMQRVDGFFSNNIRYTLNQDFDLDQNRVYVYCETSGYGGRISKIVRIDTQNPSSTQVSADSHTCGFSSFGAELSAQDELSGIEGFEFNVSVDGEDEGAFVDGFSSTRFLTVSVIDLGLSESLINESLAFRARAVDRAGNKGEWGQAGVIISDASSVECDVENPVASIDYDAITDEEGDISSYNISFSCSDSGSGCTNSLYYSIHRDGQSCTYDIEASYDTSFNLSESSRVCLKVLDRAGNEGVDENSFEIDHPLHCFNEELDGDETDVDCGGSCASCELESICEVDADCNSGYCREGVCSVASCTDGILNQGETDVDCGGPNCAGCEEGASCNANSDCGSGNCASGVCAAASCSNGIQDGDETDVDCGGSSCSACENGKSCTLNTDCASGSCNNGVCGVDSGVSDSFEDSQSSGFSTPQLAVGGLGLLSLLAGIGLIVYESNFATATAGGAAPPTPASSGTTLRKPIQDRGPSQSKLSSEQAKRAAQERLRKRKSMFEDFKGESADAAKKNIKSVRKEPKSVAQEPKLKETSKEDLPKEDVKPQEPKSIDDEIVLSGEDDVFDKLKEEAGKKK